jgi:opacity protein-like surface antigen
MKKSVLIFAMLLATAPAAFAAFDAQPGPPEAGRMALFLVGGMNVPHGDLAEGTKNGASLGAGMIYHVSSRFGFGGEIVRDGIGIDDDGLEAYGEDASVSMSIMRYTGFATMAITPPAKQMVYLKGTAGSYRGKLKLRLGSLEAESSSAEFGFGLGGGLQINGKSGTALNLEALYHNVSADGGNTNFLTTTVGIQFNIK